MIDGGRLAGIQQGAVGPQVVLEEPGEEDGTHPISPQFRPFFTSTFSGTRI